MIRSCFRFPWVATALTVCLLICPAFAQQAPVQPPAPQAESTKTQVKVNYLNVCNPSDAEQRELSAALARLPLQSKFAPDFEISRGRTTMTEPAIKLEGLAEGAATDIGPAPISDWVRLRREFPASSPLVSVQYSFSVDEKNIVETLVFRSREAKDVIETSLEDKISAVADASQALKTDTPVDRVRIERFGKPSVVVARCSGADQSVYEPLFQKGSEIMARYRALLNVRQTVPADLRRLGAGPSAASKPTADRSKHASPKPTATAPK